MSKKIEMKNKIGMKWLLGAIVGLFVFSACKKNSNSETTNVSKPAYQVGQPVSDAAPLTGAINGTMLTGKTYTINGDVIINLGDTLLIQPGVTVNMGDGADVVVKGVFLSLGTKDKPIKLTYPGVTRTDQVGADPNNDPAYTGKWEGINADTTCNLLVMKWTKVEFSGGVFGVDPPFAGEAQGKHSYSILFQNTNGNLVVEDSWFYGQIGDAIRLTSGHCEIMRNTFEKCGFQGGDVINCKSGSVGDIAYNMFMGNGTNGSKASDKGGSSIQTDINMYNNTYVDCGWRRLETGRGGSINYEQDAKGKCYNNLIVNCKYGLRIVGDPAADTAQMAYGNTFNYGDSLNVVDEFYPTGYITEPKGTDIPSPNSYLPSGYTLGQNYDGSAVIAQNDPQFVNFPLPEPGINHLSDISAVGSYDFHLKSTSPAAGKGYTGFAPLAAVQISNPNFAPSEITPPGSDIGCYQLNGSGNQH